MIKVSIPSTGEEEWQALREVILSGNFVSGEKVRLFENNFSDYLDVKATCAVNSGTAALHLALAALGVGPGDEVIVPPLTFMSTVTAVLHQNAIPIFADIDPIDWCLSSNDLARCISPRTKAIIVVHLFGNAAEMDEIQAVAKKYDLPVIEDCAQAHGTEYRGKKVGGIGRMGIFSFYATKHMTTGEGGIISSQENELVEQCKIRRNHGMASRDEHVCLGYNYRMTEMAAAIGLVQLNKLETLNQKRIDNSLYILTKLRENPRPWFCVPTLKPHVRHTFFWCPIQIAEHSEFGMDRVLARLAEHKIEVRHRYRTPLYRQPLLTEASPYPNKCPFTCAADGIVPDYSSIYLPNVEALAGRVIGLPNHALLSKEDIDYVVDVVLKLF